MVFGLCSMCQGGGQTAVSNSCVTADSCGYPSGLDIVDGVAYFVDFPVYRDDLRAASRV
jgi:hypothetical protein